MRVQGLTTTEIFVRDAGVSIDRWQNAVGQRVTHDQYGVGMITNVYKSETNGEIVINVVWPNKANLIFRIDDFCAHLYNMSLPLEIQQRKRKFEIEKRELIRRLQSYFSQNFLGAYAFYQAQCSKHISFEEYEAEKTRFVSSWIKRRLTSTPDAQQLAAISAVEDHVQVIARAGSGKTSTLVNRAAFLQLHCHVAPQEMLLLAFNRKAAEGMQARLSELLKDTIPHVMTFHALGYALVHPESILVDEPDGDQSKSYALQSIIDEYLHTEHGNAKVRSLMMAHFRGDWERITAGGYDKPQAEMLRYRRSLPRQAIDGLYVKSFGEKVIADFLFEHGIKYRYERNFWWDGVNYRPDFTVFTGDNTGIVIEYFGLKGEPEYDASSEQKRAYWKTRPEWHLLELGPAGLRDNGKEGFRKLLRQSLEDCGISCERLTEDEIWSRIKDRAIDRFTQVVVSFIQRCRKQWLSSAELAEMIAQHACVNQVEQQFLQLVQKFYASYLLRLQETHEDDFDGLLQQATEFVEAGKMVFQRRSGKGNLNNIRYILIDEYQDFSELFYRLIDAIRRRNSRVEFFCVGDDWQAINGFAGSDLGFYRDFANLFQPARQLHVDTNYRSARSVVGIGNVLMRGRGQPSRAHKNTPGIVVIGDITTFAPSPNELDEYPGDNFTPAVLRLVNRVVSEGKNVVLLSRKNSLPWYINYGNRRRPGETGNLESFLGLIRAHLPEEARKLVTISTVHRYKGLEKHTVIVLDAVARSYPLVHPDMMFTSVLGDNVEATIDEERRLFYVALTRAIERLVILTDRENVSPFLEELRSSRFVSRIDWSHYQPTAGATKRITIRVGNKKGSLDRPTLAIRDLLKAEGYKWSSTDWPSWWRTYSAKGFSIQHFINQCLWTAKADGIEVRFCDNAGTLLVLYHVERGQWVRVRGEIPTDAFSF